VIFVDTGAWFALLDRSCVEHEVAVRFAAANSEVFVTTDYVLAESLTLLRARRLHPAALELGKRLLASDLARLVWVTPDDVHRAWVLFQYQDKAWSFVDCVSFAVMQRLGIREAFAFDDHFRQMGTLLVHPQ
jgi:predicted nucleic acid-binding protein